MGLTVCKLDDYMVAKNVSDAAAIIIPIGNAKGKKHAHCLQELTSCGSVQPPNRNTKALTAWPIINTTQQS
jgi:hypothetical protein